MNILHLEASPGWGGQEIRVLNEAIGMRAKGHHVIFAITSKGELLTKARQAGFQAYSVRFQKRFWLFSFFYLIRIIRKHNIDIINTHSSLDSWLGGLVGRLLQRALVRTRHLSTAIRKGWNSRFLYHYLTDYVVTTCENSAMTISLQSGKSKKFCQSIPTGVDSTKIIFQEEKVERFRQQLGISSHDCLVGMVCFMRSWKGIKDFLSAVNLLKGNRNLKWAIIGGGHIDTYKVMAKRMRVDDQVIFTGHLDNPYYAINALDIFVLLSTAHEGVSQASLQAAYLKKPLIMTPTGGLWEVCLDQLTGIQVPPFSPKKVAQAIIELKNDKNKRKKMGEEARRLVEKNFTYEKMLMKMEDVYKDILAI